MKTIIVDIDGTIAKVGDRLKYLQQPKKNWDAFYNACDEDEPIPAIIDLVQELSQSHRVVFCTGRREEVHQKTRNWLVENYFKYMGNYWRYHVADLTLLMRPDGDTRHDTIVKPEMLEKAGIKLCDIAFVLEDRNSMVKKWRELGLTCLQVADGDF